MSNVSLVDGHIDEPKKTNYDHIRNMSVEEMAYLFYSGIDRICFDNCKQSTGNKYECSIKDNVNPDNCINFVKKWLESGVDTE